jgi:alkanesulfonate monooxygenase SsuD/methylene tetrahydromethanopterin reductase-like flavin-dependent oxidoreductase (luciferase family)
MHFGIFIEERRRGIGESEAFREAVDLADAAEAGGLDGVWLGEIHFNGTRSVQSSPLCLASFMAARTRRLRVGTAVQVLPLGNPLLIAEQAATVDRLSEGRLDFGIGRSGSARAYDILGIPYRDSQARLLESLTIIRQAWKGEPFSFQGEFYRFGETTVSPTPLQSPHPPLRMAANSDETFVEVGQLGLPIFVGLRDHDVDSLRANLAAYRQAYRDAGHPGRPDVFLRLPIYAAPTEKAAMEEPRESLTYFFRRHADLVRSGLGRADTGSAARRAALVERVAHLSYEDILRTRVAFGTAEGLIERLGAIRDDLGLDGVVAELNPSGMFSVDQMRRTLRALTDQVMPALR